jgi:hypothetical protein
MENNIKFPVEITIIVIATDLKTGQAYVVSLDKDCWDVPSIQLESKSADIYNEVCHLTDKYIDADVSWVNPIIVDTINDNGCIRILTVCEIPLDTLLKNDACYVQLMAPSNITNYSHILRTITKYESLQ